MCLINIHIDELFDRARRHDVLFTSGRHFFARPEDASASMRLNFSHADEAAAERGLAILGELLRESGSDIAAA